MQCISEAKRSQLHAYETRTHASMHASEHTNNTTAANTHDTRAHALIQAPTHTSTRTQARTQNTCSHRFFDCKNLIQLILVKLKCTELRLNLRRLPSTSKEITPHRKFFVPAQHILHLKAKNFMMMSIAHEKFVSLKKECARQQEIFLKSNSLRFMMNLHGMAKNIVL